MFGYRKLKGVSFFFSKLNDRVRAGTLPTRRADSIIKTGMNGSFKKEWNPHVSPSDWQQGHHVPDARGTHLYTGVCDMGHTARVATCDSSQRDLSDSPWGTHPVQQVSICTDLWLSSLPPITLPSLGKLCSRLSSRLAVLFQFRSTQLSTWLPAGPLARAKTHPSGLLAPVALLAFPELHSALIIPLLTTVKEEYRQALQAGSSGLLPAPGHAPVFAVVTGHCKHSITLWLLHSMWAWWRAGLLWSPGLSSVSST